MLPQTSQKIQTTYHSKMGRMKELFIKQREEEMLSEEDEARIFWEEQERPYVENYRENEEGKKS